VPLPDIPCAKSVNALLYLLTTGCSGNNSRMNCLHGKRCTIFQKGDDQGYVEVAYGRTGVLGKGKVAAHSVFCLPVCLFLAGVGAGYWVWRLYQRGE